VIVLNLLSWWISWDIHFLILVNLWHVFFSFWIKHIHFHLFCCLLHCMKYDVSCFCISSSSSRPLFWVLWKIRNDYCWVYMLNHLFNLFFIRGTRSWYFLWTSIKFRAWCRNSIPIHFDFFMIDLNSRGSEDISR